MYVLNKIIMIQKEGGFRRLLERVTLFCEKFHFDLIAVPRLAIAVSALAALRLFYDSSNIPV